MFLFSPVAQFAPCLALCKTFYFVKLLGILCAIMTASGTCQSISPWNLTLLLQAEWSIFFYIKCYHVGKCRFSLKYIQVVGTFVATDPSERLTLCMAGEIGAWVGKEIKLDAQYRCYLSVQCTIIGILYTNLAIFDYPYNH